MERIGEVTSVRGEWLEITFCRPADCEKCNACHGGRKETRLTLRGQACVGDAAIVEMPTASFMQASALAYALPLAGLLGGMFLGAALVPQAQELAGGVGAAIGLAVCCAALKLTERHRRKDTRWQPRLQRIIPRSDREAESLNDNH